MGNFMSEERAVAALEAAGIPFEIKRHGQVGSLAEAAAARGVQPAKLIKTIVVRRADGDFLFVLVPGDRQISWPKLRALLGVSRLSMPNKDVAFEVTGYERGTITPFGSFHRWPVVADSRLSEPGLVSIGGGAHGVGATVDAVDLTTALDATVADVTDPA
jgi:Cys-tRNA(Pro)/Cys-tRNA(Cys) deacylase